jgi:hypothetical protein
LFTRVSVIARYYLCLVMLGLNSEHHGTKGMLLMNLCMTC